MNRFEEENDEPGQRLADSKPKVSSRMSAVASSPKKNMLILVIIICVTSYFLYGIIFDSGSEDKAKTEQAKEEVKIDESKTIKSPTITQEEDFTPPPSSAPSLPEPPALIAPEPPKENIPEPIEIKDIPEPIALPASKKPVGKETSERLNSSMFISSKGAAGENKDEKTGDKKKSNNLSLYSDDNQFFMHEHTSATQAKATKYGMTSHSIAQGKIIDSILETAINTDLPGPIRAIVSRNVYGESGNKILIPRGSRIVGVYGASTTTGVNRVAIVWNRLIRPDGVDISLESPGIDSLGRAGISGFFDNKFYEIIRNAALISALKIGVASASNAGSITTTTSTDAEGKTTTSKSGTARNLAIKEAIEDLGKTTEDVLKDSLQEKPRILIDQGTIVKVFVNKDLIFPAGDSKF